MSSGVQAVAGHVASFRAPSAWITGRFVSLPERIEQARRRAGYKKATDFAKRVGWTAKQVRRWETGTSEPTSEAITAIADATGVTTDWLLKGGKMPDLPIEPLYAPELARFLVDTPQGRAASAEVRLFMHRITKAVGVSRNEEFFHDLLDAARHMTPEELQLAVKNAPDPAFDRDE